MSTGCRSLLAAYRRQSPPVKAIVLGPPTGLIRKRHPPEVTRPPPIPAPKDGRNINAIDDLVARDPDQHRPG